MCMYVSEICAEGIFVTFPWWLKNVKSGSKIALFSNERHFEIWFPKKKTITFFWNKLSKLHQKDPILHVATTFSPKQGETRTSHGPIPHPLITFVARKIKTGLPQANVNVTQRGMKPAFVLKLPFCGCQECIQKQHKPAPTTQNSQIGWKGGVFKR